MWVGSSLPWLSDEWAAALAGRRVARGLCGSGVYLEGKHFPGGGCGVGMADEESHLALLRAAGGRYGHHGPTSE